MERLPDRAGSYRILWGILTRGPRMDAATEVGSRRRVDPMTTLMIVMTAAGLLGAAWLRYGPSPAPPPPTVGGLAPPLQILDLDSSEPMVLAGLRGKVVWVVFWSANSTSGPASLPALDDVWNRLEIASAVRPGGGRHRDRSGGNRP